MGQTLLKEKRYSGNYVALKDCKARTVIAYGKEPKEVYEKALRKGCQEPFLLYVPIKGMVQIY